MLRGSQEVEDVAQAALARVWRFRRSCRTPAAPEAWCAAIARNEALRFLAGQSNRAQTSTEFYPELVDQQAAREIEATVLRLDLDRALSAATAQEQHLLRLRYHEDLPIRQIAGLLDMNETTARVQLHRARRRLRAELVGSHHGGAPVPAQ